ncbi:MAG: PA2778 family cysteine peptidase [Steroidobacteraceae bacterium]
MPIRLPAAAGLLLLLAGCATPAQHARAFWNGREPARVELTAVPFHPQRDYQCGPAALATVLGAGGADVEPDELAHEVFIPGRRGSLQTELAASARRRGFLPYVLRPDSRSLLGEVASGRPVLVLQNLGVRLWPRWHYAVVVGYDVEKDRLLLRSGERERVSLPRARFEGTWQRAERWAMVVVQPGDIPASAEAGDYAAAVADLESAGGGSASLLAAYSAGHARWPDDALLTLGVANQKAALADAPGAEALLRGLLLAEPGHVPARNNLAVVLMRMGRFAEALREATAALAAAKGTAWERTVIETIDEIRAAQDPAQAR